MLIQKLKPLGDAVAVRRREHRRIQPSQTLNQRPADANVAFHLQASGQRVVTDAEFSQMINDEAAQRRIGG